MKVHTKNTKFAGLDARAILNESFTVRNECASQCETEFNHHCSSNKALLENTPMQMQDKAKGMQANHIE